MSLGLRYPSLVTHGRHPWVRSGPNNAIFGSHYRREIMGPFHISAWLCALSTEFLTEFVPVDRER